jgi:predicted branched-subunit amino acid permease
VIDALPAPALVLGASYVGFGSLCRESALSLAQGLVSTASAWALPGQIATIELFAIGTNTLLITLAVALTNARLLPMTVTLMPFLRAPGIPRWRYFLFAHFVAVTAWAQGMQRCPLMPAEQRLPYFAGFALTLWLASLLGTAIGYVAAGVLPDAVTLGFVFLNPLYFMLIFLSDLRQRLRALALALGAALGPPLFLIDSEWGLLMTGLAAGTAAFLLDRHLRAARPR